MEDHHWGGQGWNLAVEPQEKEKPRLRSVHDKIVISFQTPTVLRIHGKITSNRY
jgi:hypothetical protein